MQTQTGNILRRIASKYGGLTDTFSQLASAANRYELLCEQLEALIILNDENKKVIDDITKENKRLREENQAKTDELYRLRAAAGSENRW